MKIIQGGMGAGVSGWNLAKAVSQTGQLGVVSGTGLGVLMVRRMQTGEWGKHFERAMSNFPIPGVVQRIMDRYAKRGKKTGGFSLTEVPRLVNSPDFYEMTVLGNFVEVFLAKEGGGKIGINYLEKMQLPTLPSIYGAMLAGVDYILMGAGIPRHIPGTLDALSQGLPAELPIDVEGAMAGERFVTRFDPKTFFGGTAPVIARPKFLAIISSAVLAMTLARKSNGKVDGFVVEGHVAGGHNAPPRGTLQYNSRGEPVYGDRDKPDIEKIRDVGLPFWLAGGYASSTMLSTALEHGASGIQVGTAFAFCRESGITPEIKQKVIKMSQTGKITVKTDALASPTGFPFKVLQLEGTMSQNEVYESRARICDLGYLCKTYRQADGTVGYRCPAEPVERYVAKGGKAEDTVGRKCICNALFGTIGMGQTRGEGFEPAIVTAGDDVANVAEFLKEGEESYSAQDVVDRLLKT